MSSNNGAPAPQRGNSIRETARRIFSRTPPFRVIRRHGDDQPGETSTETQGAILPLPQELTNLVLSSAVAYPRSIIEPWWPLSEASKLPDHINRFLNGDPMWDREILNLFAANNTFFCDGPEAMVQGTWGNFSDPGALDIARRVRYFELDVSEVERLTLKTRSVLEYRMAFEDLMAKLFTAFPEMRQLTLSMNTKYMMTQVLGRPLLHELLSLQQMDRFHANHPIEMDLDRPTKVSEVIYHLVRVIERTGVLPKLQSIRLEVRPTPERDNERLFWMTGPPADDPRKNTIVRNWQIIRTTGEDGTAKISFNPRMHYIEGAR